ncbi:TPA: hypothetical protein SMP26_001866 [Proteus mirabilis]|nr:hypothetical protein [Proteus mirabilis]
MKELESIIIRAGQPLHIECVAGSEIQIGNSKNIIHEIPSSRENETITTRDFPEGKYSVVVMKDDAIVSVQELTITPFFTKQTKEDFLREMIKKIEAVIDARLSGDEPALQQMSVKGNTFAYESLAVLNQLRDNYRRELSQLILAKRKKEGISPISNIHIRLTR